MIHVVNGDVLTDTTARHHSNARSTTNTSATLSLNPVFVRPGESTGVPRFTIPDGLSMPETAYRIVRDEAMLDGNARLNLATFVTTWMDDEARRFYAASQRPGRRGSLPRQARDPDAARGHRVALSSLTLT